MPESLMQILLVILNDNAIGIDPSVGALKNYLTEVKRKIRGKIT
jgi:1-deoxy-D-xylulose-5-phosphate synthase